MMRDGLYRIEERNFVAGFVVEGGRVVRCAPILRKSIKHWLPRAKFVGDF